MSYFGDRPKGFLEWWDAIDFWVYAVLAGAAVAVGPILVAVHLVANGKIEYAGLVVAVWISSLAVCIRDLVRKKWSWVSTVVFGFWFVAMFALSCAG